MHRFFLFDHPIVPGHEVDITPIAHQLRVVLRLQSGTQIVLLDGQGYAYPTEIVRLERKRALGAVLGREPVNTEPGLDVTLYQCSLKADKFEWVLQKGTELGIACFVPVISQRSVVRPAAALAKKYPRWRTIVQEAAEQCGRGRLPHIEPPMRWPEAVVAGSGLRLMPWEESPGHKPCLALSEVLAAVTSLVRVSLLIGPEGGIASEEAGQAVAAGWHTVTLGPRILRAETAALAAATMVLYHGGDLGHAGRV